MPEENAHRRQAEHNEAFLTTLDLATSPYLDWAVTAVFYAALHYIRALAARHHFTNISSYADMDRLFERVVVFRRRDDLYADYRQLKDDSRAARYDCRRFTPAEVAGLRDEELHRVRIFVLAEIGTAA